MKKEFVGIIVKESLKDKSILKKLDVLSTETTRERNPVDRWHLYTVSVSEKEIDALSKKIKPKWYMHFWKNKKVIAVFKDKKFEFTHNEKSTWKPAIEYGISVGIPKKQLDFKIKK
jgi:hypothetical protein